MRCVRVIMRSSKTLEGFKLSRAFSIISFIHIGVYYFPFLMYATCLMGVDKLLLSYVHPSVTILSMLFFDKL